MPISMHLTPNKQSSIHVCGFFVTLVVTILIVVHVNSLPLYITTENNDVIEPDAVLILIYQSQYTLPLINCLSIHTYVWSLSCHHYDEKETMDNILILHQVQGDIMIFSGDVQRGWHSVWIYYKAVTTMVTNKGHQLLKTLFVRPSE